MKLLEIMKDRFELLRVSSINLSLKNRIVSLSAENSIPVLSGWRQLLRELLCVANEQDILDKNGIFN